jgi:drug/metabolite transporter (DMT)-like permease
MLLERRSRAPTPTIRKCGKTDDRQASICMNRLLATKQPARPIAIAEGVLVTLIWASSFVFVKMALDYLEPLTVAGLRYFLAFLMLLPFMSRSSPIPSLSPHLWLRLFLIGLSAYAIGNGATFWGLKYVPATTASFLLSLIPLLILFAGTLWLREVPTRLQVMGTVISLAGSGLFFSSGLRADEPLGMGLLAVGLVSFACFGILGRGVARGQQVDTLPLTAFPLAFGGGLLLLVALPLEGMPRAPLTAWGIVLWLATVNTALAYMLYNHAIQVLTALEMNVILNLSPLVTAIIAWLVLDEKLSAIQILGIIVVIVGVILVQRGK